MNQNKKIYKTEREGQIEKISRRILVTSVVS